MSKSCLSYQLVSTVMGHVMSTGDIIWEDAQEDVEAVLKDWGVSNVNKTPEPYTSEPMSKVAETYLERAQSVLNKLVEEHGTETFVSNGYGYYDDAADAFVEMMATVEDETLEAIAQLASTQKEERLDAFAALIRSFKKGKPNG